MLRIVPYLFFYLSFGLTQNRFYAKPSVAVLSFEAKGVSGNEAQSLRDIFELEISKTKKMILVDPYQVDEVVLENNYDQPNCSSVGCAKEIGLIMGVQKIIFGSFKIIGDSCIISAELININKGEALRTSEITFDQKAFNDSTKDGLATQWHENGKKSSEVTYKDGERDGIATQWHESGKKSSEAIYKDGKRDGLATKWHENGQKNIVVYIFKGKSRSFVPRTKIIAWELAGLNPPLDLLAEIGIFPEGEEKKSITIKKMIEWLPDFNR